MTRQRQVILEELQTLRFHPTAADLYQVVRQRLPRISLGTIYRTLETLVDSGVIRKMMVGGREARFDAILTDHDHICCIKCGRIEDFPHPQGLRLEDHGSDVEGWKIQECRVEFLGVCPDCNLLDHNASQ